MADQRAADRQSVSSTSSSSAMSKANSLPNSLPNSPSSKSSSNAITPNVDTPPIGYAKTDAPGSARRYVRT